MNDHLSEKLSLLRQETLTPEERVSLKNGILDVVRANPIVARSSLGARATFRAHRKPIAISSALILFLLSGSVSFAAETALPGDTLYPVKTKVNEGVKRALAFTPEQKAIVARKEVERRVTEAEALVKTDRFSTSTKTILADDTKRSLNTFSEAKKKLVDEGKKTKAEEYERSLDETMNRHKEGIRVLGIQDDRSDHRLRDREDLRGRDHSEDDLVGVASSFSSKTTDDRGRRRERSVATSSPAFSSSTGVFMGDDTSGSDRSYADDEYEDEDTDDDHNDEDSRRRGREGR